MADLSDVESVLVSTITQAIYPNGTGHASAITAACKIYRGWPIPANLDADMAAGIVNISIFPLDVEQNTTRYLTDWQALPSSTPALTLTVSGTTITVGGTVSSPLNAAALVQVGATKRAFVYAVQPNDTLTTIATGLSALINAFTPATSVGAVITVSGSTLIARVGAVGSAVSELKRQKRSFRITLWCPNPAVRDAAGIVIDGALAALTFISLPDGTVGRVRYERSHIDDMPEKANLYRRDLVYSVEYGTTATMVAPAIVAELINISGGLDPNSPPVTTLTI